MEHHQRPPRTPADGKPCTGLDGFVSSNVIPLVTTAVLQTDG